MYLTTAKTVDEVLVYGIEPAIEFLDMAQDERLEGNDRRAATLEFEGRSKLMVCKEKLESIAKDQRAARQQEEACTEIDDN